MATQVERIAIFAALQWECRPVLHHLRQVRRERQGGATVWRGTAAACEVWVVKTGMGLARAAAAVRVLHDVPRFDLVVSTGCAGALSAEMVPGDLAIASALMGTAGERYPADLARREQLRRVAMRAGLRCSEGPVLSSPAVLATVAEKRAAAERGCIAVEMEGVPIAACAMRAAIPVVSVRAILDAADTELPHVGRVIDPQNGALKPFGLARYLATHPGALPALLSMQHMRRAAEGSLSRLFAVWFEDRHPTVTAGDRRASR